VAGQCQGLSASFFVDHSVISFALTPVGSAAGRLLTRSGYGPQSGCSVSPARGPREWKPAHMELSRFRVNSGRAPSVRDSRNNLQCGATLNLSAGAGS